MLHKYDRGGDERQSHKREDAAPHILARDLRRRRCKPHTRAGFGQDVEYAHRPRDVLYLLLASILVTQRELVSHLLMDITGDADAAGVGEAFEACGDIDAVAVDLLAVHHHVAEVDADAELHPPLGWQRSVFCLERGLDLDGAL